MRQLIHSGDQPAQIIFRALIVLAQLMHRFHLLAHVLFQRRNALHKLDLNVLDESLQGFDVLFLDLFLQLPGHRLKTPGHRLFDQLGQPCFHIARTAAAAASDSAFPPRIRIPRIAERFGQFRIQPAAWIGGHRLLALLHFRDPAFDFVQPVQDRTDAVRHFRHDLVIAIPQIARSFRPNSFPEALRIRRARSGSPRYSGERSSSNRPAPVRAGTRGGSSSRCLSRPSRPNCGEKY